MERASLQQQDLAFDLRVDPALVSKVIRGKQDPPTSLLEKLASYEPLDVPYQRLRAWRTIDKIGAEDIAAAFKELTKHNPGVETRKREAYKRAGKDQS